MALESAVAAVVRQIREEKDMTVKSLADEVGLSSGHMSQIETGKRGLSLDTLKLICDVLGVKASTVIRRAESGNGNR